MTAAVVHRIDEGGWVIRTPGGVAASRTALTGYLGPGGPDDGYLTCGHPPDLPRVIERFLDRMRYQDGWWRWSPCSPRSCWDGGNHSGHLQPADGPGRGVWRGVTVYHP